MTWEEKSEMIQCCNKEDYSGAIKIFMNCLPDIDEQGWDMFVTGIELTSASIRLNLDNHIKIIEASKDVTFDSFTTAVRWGYYETLVEEALKEK